MSACVASAKRRWAGSGMAMMVQMNGLYRAVVMRRAKCGRVIFLYLVCCSLSEVRSGRFEGRGLGVLSRLETGRRGNGRSGQRVGDRHCLCVAGEWAGDRTVSACVQLPCCCRCQIESMDDDQSRETRSVQLAATCLASWVVNGESVGGELEEKGECLPFLPCLPLSCLAQLACLVLAWLRFGAGKEQGVGVCGCTVLSTGTMQCNLRMD